MSSIPSASADAARKSAASSPNGIERRRRKRAKITAQVHLRTTNSPEPIEEICKSIDVSRDGLLFTAARAGYWKGQRLEVTFPYSTAAAALNQAQEAEIVRVTEAGPGQFHVAVQFHAAKAEARGEKKGAVADPFVGGAGESAPAAGAKQQSVVLAVEPDQRTADLMRDDFAERRLHRGDRPDRAAGSGSFAHHRARRYSSRKSKPKTCPATTSA